MIVHQDTTETILTDRGASGPATIVSDRSEPTKIDGTISKFLWCNVVNYIKIITFCCITNRKFPFSKMLHDKPVAHDSTDATLAPRFDIKRRRGAFFLEQHSEHGCLTKCYFFSIINKTASKKFRNRSIDFGRFRGVGHDRRRRGSLRIVTDRFVM